MVCGPINPITASGLFCINFHYRLVYLYNRLGEWVYPFMASFNFISFTVFVVLSTIVGGGFYCFGKFLAQLFGRNSKYYNYNYINGPLCSCNN